MGKLKKTFDQDIKTNRSLEITNDLYVSGNTFIYNNFIIKSGNTLEYYPYYNRLILGQYNTISVSSNCLIVGTNNNVISDDINYTYIFGSGNTIQSRSLSADNSYGFVNGKNNSLLYGSYTVILNGLQNTHTVNNAAMGNFNIIGTGFLNYLDNSDYSNIFNGQYNSILVGIGNENYYDTIINGSGNTLVSSDYSTILNGSNNKIDSSNYSSILNGIGLNLTGNSYSVILGKYNYSGRSNSDNVLFVIGNGTNDSNRNDAFVVKGDGQVFINGNLYSTGTTIDLSNYYTSGQTNQIFVTSGTTQNITGEKTFTTGTTFLDNMFLNSGKTSYIKYNQTLNSIDFYI